MTTQCIICDNQMPPTLGESICSPQCKKEWAVEQLSDGTTDCPMCGKSLTSESGTIQHVQSKHFHFERTEDCQQCGDTFVPTSSTNPNKYCSKTCFGLAHRKYENLYTTTDCHNCGEEFEYYQPVYDALGRERKYCSFECANWKNDAITRTIRGTPEYYQWKKAVRARGDSCEVCGESDKELHAHHIIPISENRGKAYDVSNGELRCKSCHAKAHSDNPAIEQLLTS